ncbi:MAG: hypothetical protein K6T75_10300 [Acetobacteraceae bacterium]|nr:hypothetical protein [Acetobacteraceae bacterium]
MKLWWLSLCYQARLTFGWYHVVAPVGLAVALVLGQAGQAGLSPRQVVRWVEILVPVAGIFLAAPIIMRDRDLAVAELQAAKPRGLMRQFVWRYALIIMYTTLTSVLLAFAAGAETRDPRFLAVLLASVVPSLLFFSLLAAVASMGAGGVASGAAVAVVLWGALTAASLVSRPTGPMAWVAPFPLLLGLQTGQFTVNRCLYIAAWAVMSFFCHRLLRFRAVLPPRE